MGQIVDENLKSDLIMSKQIRQATRKILQRPSHFNGQNHPRKARSYISSDKMYNKTFFLGMSYFQVLFQSLFMNLSCQ